jgi:UDP-2,4-diacetamido-2,4,6-trideoxy-beta-L-altropyranose hydrolase
MTRHLSPLVIRADARQETGMGHVMRCLALADAWRDLSGEVLFFSIVESQALRARLVGSGYAVVEPGRTPQATLKELQARGLAGCWVAIDGYDFQPEWQAMLGESGFRVLCIDDGARLKQYAAPVILASDPDASLVAYNAPSSSLILTGTQWRLLRKEFVCGSPRRSRAELGAVILVVFGGSDRRNVARTVLDVLAGCTTAQDRVRLVFGALNPHRASICEALAALPGQSELVENVEDMAQLYREADIAISAAGTTAWEMAACGLPAILVPVADNQLPAARALSAAGAAAHLPIEAMAGPRGLAEILARLLQDRDKLARMSKQGPLVCDGGGAARVCRVLQAFDDPAPSPAMQVRRATADDAEQVFRIANDTIVRANAFSAEPISLAAHLKWFATKLASTDSALYVLDLAGLVVALARYDRVGDAATIDIAVHAAFRAKGLGVELTRRTVEPACAALGVKVARAVVFAQNVPSQRCFLGAGWQQLGTRNIQGIDCVEFETRFEQEKANDG